MPPNIGIAQRTFLHTGVPVLRHAGMTFQVEVNLNPSLHIHINGRPTLHKTINIFFTPLQTPFPTLSQEQLLLNF